MDNNFFEENFIIVIGRDGRIDSIPRKEGEVQHSEPFLRLDKKLKIFDDDVILATSQDLPNIVAKRGYINIFPFLVYEGVESQFVVVFPFNPSKEQLDSLTTLYGELETVRIGYFEKPDVSGFLFYNNLKEGFENLKKFVQQKLEECNKRQINKKEGIGK